MTPETALNETVGVMAAHAELYSDEPEGAPWLVISAVLAVQQAAAIALRAAGDSIPAQAGATELVLRVASKDRLPAPFTLPFGVTARQSFDALVEARNQFMHPRGQDWHLAEATLWSGLCAVTDMVRHLVLPQPVLEDLITPDQQDQMELRLAAVELVAEFYEAPGF